MVLTLSRWITPCEGRCFQFGFFLIFIFFSFWKWYAYYLSKWLSFQRPGVWSKGDISVWLVGKSMVPTFKEYKFQYVTMLLQTKDVLSTGIVSRNCIQPSTIPFKFHIGSNNSITSVSNNNQVINCFYYWRHLQFYYFNASNGSIFCYSMSRIGKVSTV